MTPPSSSKSGKKKDPKGLAFIHALVAFMMILFIVIFVIFEIISFFGLLDILIYKKVELMDFLILLVLCIGNLWIAGKCIDILGELIEK